MESMAQILIATKQNTVLREKCLHKLCDPNGWWCDTHSLMHIQAVTFILVAEQTHLKKSRSSV
jgi:hypothetical protein